VAAQEPHEPLAVGAAALHPKALRLAEGAGPREQLLVTAGVSRDGDVAKALAEQAEHDSDENELVSVDANHDRLAVATV